MKHQVMNGSFGKILAAAALGFVLSTAAPLQAQQGRWGSDNCFYAPTQGGQMVRQGCMLRLNGNQFYYDIRTSVMTDLRTNSSYRVAQQNGRLLVNAGNGWVGAGPATAGLPGATGGAGRVGGVYTGTGTMNVGGWTHDDRPDSVWANPKMAPILGAADRNIQLLLAPNRNSSYNGYR
jgi:hypothetical protein